MPTKKAGLKAEPGFFRDRDPAPCLRAGGGDAGASSVAGARASRARLSRAASGSVPVDRIGAGAGRDEQEEAAGDAEILHEQQLLHRRVPVHVEEHRSGDGEAEKRERHQPIWASTAPAPKITYSVPKMPEKILRK